MPLKHPPKNGFGSPFGFPSKAANKGGVLPNSARGFDPRVLIQGTGPARHGGCPGCQVLKRTAFARVPGRGLEPFLSFWFGCHVGMGQSPNRLAPVISPIPTKNRF